MKLLRFGILAASAMLLTPCAAHGQTSVGDEGAGTANLDSSLQLPVDNPSGPQFNWRDSSLITDPIASQAIFTENFEPGPPESPADQPLVVSTPALTAETASQSTTTVSATSDSD